MNTVNVTFRIDNELKKQAESLFMELGMNLSTAFNIFLRQAVREQQIPFAITTHVPNATTISAMDDAMNNRNLSGPFDSIQEFMEDLDA